MWVCGNARESERHIEIRVEWVSLQRKGFQPGLELFRIGWTGSIGFPRPLVGPHAPLPGGIFFGVRRVRVVPPAAPGVPPTSEFLLVSSCPTTKVRS